MNIKLYNTLTRAKEDFSPIDPKEVRMYTCGPTVYNYAHIGNLRSYVFADTLRRALKYFDYNVKQVINITDIGHLASDADSGDDKMTKGLLREGKELNLQNMRLLAEFYTDRFKEDLQKLNILTPSVLAFASDYINEDVELIQRLEKNGFTYKITDGIYFDTEKFPEYGVLRNGIQKNEDEESRIGLNSEKHNTADFALWKFDPKIGYPSPWGQGFPGWHIECSAMGIKFLGEQFDIHTGGIDHIPVHHTNEIAQSECATGKSPFVKYWLHHEHLDMAGEKMAKSGDNFLRLKLLEEKDINPLAYRFWLLMGNYRTKMNFNYEALEGAQTALKRLFRAYIDLGSDLGVANSDYQNKFKEYIADDLDTPKALTLIWDILKDEKVSNADKKTTLLDFDKVLGLGLDKLKEDNISDEVTAFAEEREQARKNKDFQKSDDLREKINSLGYEIKDIPEGYKIFKI
ncbi:MAG: cysteine--tRNA ligase [Candidatus Nomurabacteria bacterium]|nr:cysteine--tRNA ligase [Candidatus Nomurabacteria bacterium]